MFTRLTLVSIFALASFVNGCGETIQPSTHIVIERELLLPSLRIQPHQVIQTADGNIIVAGEWGQVSAVALSKNGEELWKYQEPYDPKIPGQYQGQFAGVVSLANGDLLFCGDKRVANLEKPQNPGSHTITTVLSARGTLKSSSTIDPEDPSLHAVDFSECSPLGDGALIFGRIYSPSPQPLLRWVVKVDHEGKKQWERVGGASDEFKPPFAATHATPTGATFWSFPGNSNEILRLTRVSSSGEVTNSHEFPCGYYLMHFDTVEPSDSQSFLCAPRSNEMAVFRLTGGPQQSATEIDLKDALHSNFIAQLGRGFELKDGSFLVFGRIPTQSGDRAVIQLFDKTGHSLGFRGYDLQYPSFGVDSVYSLGNSRFLALRQHLGGGGTVMSWVSVN